MIFKINKSDERKLNAVIAIITRGEKEAGGQNYYDGIMHIITFL
jgi:hypothetical protein